MHLKSTLSTLLTVTALLVTGPVLAQHANTPTEAKSQPATKSGELIRVTEKDAAWAKEQRAVYPLGVCVSSGEKLGSMGKAPEYIYRVAGQPDRLVVFCCAGCDEDFLQNPAEALAKIDAAKAKRRPNPSE